MTDRVKSEISLSDQKRHIHIGIREKDSLLGKEKEKKSVSGLCTGRVRKRESVMEEAENEIFLSCSCASQTFKCM